VVITRESPSRHGPPINPHLGVAHGVVRGGAYQKHRHDAYAVCVTDSGVQVFDYRGSVHASTLGQVTVLYPDEVHDGRAGTSDGFGYRIVYVEPSLLAEAIQVLRGRPAPLPFVEHSRSAR
jgi:hypothetical protein